jgi:hypothetical protein
VLEGMAVHNWNPNTLEVQARGVEVTGYIARWDAVSKDREVGMEKEKKEKKEELIKEWCVMNLLIL